MSRRIAIAALAIAATSLPSAATSAAALAPAGASAREAPEVELPGVLEDEEWTRHNGWMRD